MTRKAISGTMLALLLTCLLSFASNIELASSVPSSPYIMVVPEETVDPTIEPGMNYTISIYTDYAGSDVWAWQFTLTFNPIVLQMGLDITDTWIGDGVTAAFAASRAPVVEYSEKIYVDQTLMTRDVDYTIVYETGEITFTTAPGLGAEAKAEYIWTGLANGDLIASAKDPSATYLPGTFDNTAGKLSLTCAFFFYTSPPPIPTTSGPGTLAYITFRVVGYGSSDIILGQHTKLLGPAQPPDYLFAYAIIDAKQQPDHIQHGFFNNVQPIHDVAVARLKAPSTTFARQLAPITVIVANEGNYTESGTVRVSYNATEVGTVSFTLVSGLSKTLSFNWDTTGLPQGTYTITAEATLDGDADLSDNFATTIVVISGTLLSVPHYDQITSYYCGPASLEMVFDFYGPDISQLEIADAALTISPHGTGLGGMIRATHFSNLSMSMGDEMSENITGYSTRKLGYAAFAHWGFTLEELKSLVDSGYPIIVATQFAIGSGYGHLRTVVGYNETHVILNDPWWGPMLNVTNSEFLELWEHYYCWGLFVSPWQVSIDASPKVQERDTFTVTATATYPCPTPFSTSDYPASMTNATIMLPQGISLSSGETAKKPLGTGNVPAGYSATVSWIVHADSPGIYEIGIQAEGKVDGYWYQDRVGGFASRNITVVPASARASVDIDPDTLNLKSKGKWITAYIELPEGYDPGDIDVSSILLNGTVQPVLDPRYDFVTNSSVYLVDHNNDGILERMVRFNKTEVASWISSDLGIHHGSVALTITGKLLDEAPFEATDTVELLFPGDVDDDGDVDFNDFIIFSGCYGTSIENPSYVPGADFNEDGAIDFDDFTILAGNYGKTAV